MRRIKTNTPFSNMRKISIVISVVFLNMLFKPHHILGDEIIGFGDSIAKGTPYVEERHGNGRRVGGYEPDLEALLENEGRPSFVYNWGIGGEATFQGVSRIDDVLGRYNHLDYALIIEGTNDIGVISVDATISNLSRMIDICRDRNVEPIIATLTPDTLNVKKKGNLIPRVYNPRIRKLAAAKQAILADQYNATAKNWSSLTYDGEHLNKSGYQVMAQTWMDAILTGISSLRPRVKTLDAVLIDKTSAILNGSVNPNKNKTFYYFEYGTSDNYGKSTDMFAAGSGDATMSVGAGINILSENTTYHYRIVADSDKGTSFGEDRTFFTGKTGSAPVNTFAATNIGEKTAKLNGSLDPGGNPTQYYFEYGTDTNYGKKTRVKNAGSEKGQVRVSEDITGLENNTTYHYRLVAKRNNTKEFGNDMVFETGTNGSKNGSGSGCFITAINKDSRKN